MHDSERCLLMYRLYILCNGWGYELWKMSMMAISFAGLHLMCLIEPPPSRHSHSASWEPLRKPENTASTQETHKHNQEERMADQHPRAKLWRGDGADLSTARISDKKHHFLFIKLWRAGKLSCINSGIHSSINRGPKALFFKVNPWLGLFNYSISILAPNENNENNIIKVKRLSFCVECCKMQSVCC